MNDVYLQHHGIKGQRWGVRRENTGYKSEKKTMAQKKHDKAMTTRSARVLKKNMKYLSDKELRERLNRLQMEKNVKDISASDKKRAEKAVNEAIKVSTMVATSKITKKVVEAAIYAAMKKSGSYIG